MGETRRGRGGARAAAAAAAATDKDFEAANGIGKVAAGIELDAELGTLSLVDDSFDPPSSSSSSLEFS